MTFLIESLVACALFTLFVFLMSRNPIKSIFNYPPSIIERCDQLGLVDASNHPGGTVFLRQEDCRHDGLCLLYVMVFFFKLFYSFFHSHSNIRFISSYR